MPNRIEHKIANGVELKRCGVCDKYKELGAFHKANNTWDGLFYKCIKCVNSERAGNTRRRAVGAYKAIVRRCTDDQRYIKKGVAVKIDLEPFVKWYQEHYFKGCHVDRKNNLGHYELSNIQLISQREHNFKLRNDRLDKVGIKESKGMRYCFACESMKPESEFYKKKRKISEGNPNGLDEECKECSRKTRMDYYYRTKP